MSDLTMAISRKPREMPPLIGTSRMLEDFGTDVTPCAVKVGQNGSVKIGRAISAALSSTLLFAKAEIARGFVALNARSLRIESVARLDNYEDVYCITVPSSETFSLWNGAVVHNCSHAADAFRYLSMTLDRRVISTGFDRKIIYPNLGIA